MMHTILFILCIILTMFLGWNIVYLVTRKIGYPIFSVFEAIGLSSLFGFGLTSVEMFILSLFNIEFSIFNIVGPWIPIIVLNIIFIRKGALKRVAIFSKEREPFTTPDFLVTGLIAVQIIYNFFRAIIKPIESYDAVAIWGLKSKIIYMAKGISIDFFKDVGAYFHGAHPDYPLLVPLSETWVYTFLGAFDDLIVKALFPIFLLSFVFVFYSVLKKVTKNRLLSLVFTFALVSIKQFSDYSTIGVADLLVGIYFAISLFYIYLWILDKKNSYFLNISLISSILCLWTKNEGTLLMLIILFTLFFYIATNIKLIGKAEVLRIFTYTCIAALFLVSWHVFKNYHGLINENFNLSMVSVKSFLRNIYRIPPILYEYQKHLFGFKKWNIAWILFFLILLKEFRYVFSNKIKYFTITFLLFGLSYGLIYIFSAVEIKFFLRFTGSRFLLHILPVAIFWMTVVVNERKLIEI